MSMLKSKVAKVAVIFMAVAMTIVPLNAFAKTQVERDTYHNRTVYCSLETNFYFFENDTATATTEWLGQKGYSVKTVLWAKLSRNGDYIKLGVATGSKIAKVSRSKSGVYEFMSKHYCRVGNNDKKNTRIELLQDT